MADPFYIRLLGGGNLAGDKAVIEHRADLATQCECLAAWDDERECVCDRVIEAPLDRKRLERANKLNERVKHVERTITEISKTEHDILSCHTYRKKGQQTGEYGYCYSDREHMTTFNMPRALILAALNDERQRLLAELAETGIISVERNNIRGAPQ